MERRWGERKIDRSLSLQDPFHVEPDLLLRKAGSRQKVGAR
jgi:hypothetical protein